MRRLFEESRVAGIVVASTVLAVVTSWATRRLRMPPLLAWFVSMMCMLWWIAALFFRDSLWGPFPTGETFEQIGAAIRVGADEIYREAVPVEPTDAKMMLVAAGVWVTAWIAEAAALWIGSSLVAVVCTVPMFVLPGALARSERRGLETGLYVATIGAMLALDQAKRVARLTPRRKDGKAASWRPASTARLITAVLIAVLFVQPMLPGFGGSPGFAGVGEEASAIRFNPIVAIKPTLDNDTETTLFVVRTSRPAYYRLTSLEVFNGEAWVPGPRSMSERPLDRETPVWPSRTLEQVISMRALAGDWLPAAFDPVFIGGANAVSIEQPTGALVVPGGLRFGEQYFVRSEVPRPDRELLDREVDYDRDALRDYLRLEDVPRRIEQIARDITRGARTPFQQALAIQEHLRGFRYDESIASGHSFDTLEEFLLETKAGYCEQFAGSMAVLLRTLGIPSRVSIGFARGTEVAPNEYEVTTEHAHAWVEVFFPQAGWVLFEPTPRGGLTSPPRYTEAAPTPGQTTRPEDEGSASASPTPTTSAGGRDPLDPGRGSDGRGAGEERITLPLLVAAGLVLALALLALAVRLSGRVRLARARSAADQVWARYADLLAWCASAGFPRRQQQTPAEHARALAAAAPEAGPPAATVATLVEQALWAPQAAPDADAFDPAADQVRAALRAGMPVRRRLLMALGWGRWRSAT